VKFAVRAICCALACLCFEAPPRAQPSKPNILLIQADDLGYGDVSVYGQAMFQTPNVDRLARNGLRFISYYAGSTVCAPSRNALMTGMHTGHTWVRGNLSGMSLRAEDRTIAMLLKEAGYRTALIGKWGLGESESPGRPDR
jgi:arylsulfatase A